MAGLSLGFLTALTRLGVPKCRAQVFSVSCPAGPEAHRGQHEVDGNQEHAVAVSTQPPKPSSQGQVAPVAGTHKVVWHTVLVLTVSWA